MARGLKFRILKVEGLYYLCSENKSAYQLRDYREADLRLCFRTCKRRFSHNEAHILIYENIIRTSDPKSFEIKKICVIWIAGDVLSSKMLKSKQ